jgi:hypothetical protein
MRLYRFVCSNLPRTIFGTLKGISKAYGYTQREVVIAGVIALCRLGETDEHLARRVLAEARAISDRERGRGRPAPEDD